MARVLLIRPQQVRWIDEAKRVATPVGLLSIAAVLREKGHDVNFIDATIEGYRNEREIKKGLFEFGLGWDELEKRMDEIKPEIVGIQSSLTSYFGQAAKVARLAKKLNQQIVTVVGGQHATGVAEEILKLEPAIDYVIKGESEEKFLELVTSLKYSTKHYEKVLHGNATDMNALPNPAFDLVNPKDCDIQMSQFGLPRGKTFVTHLITRGCPGGCSFCTSTTFFGKTIRHYPIKKIDEQFNTLRELGFEEYVSQDDHVVAWPPSFRKEVFSLLKKSGMHWNLDGGLYYTMVTQDFVADMAEANCYRTYLPVENPDLELMHSYGKYRAMQSIEQQKNKVREVTEMINQSGVQFYSAIMIGFPGETWQSILSAIEYAKELKDVGALGIGFHWVHPYPFTQFYDSTYKLVEEENKWQNCPEKYTLIKPVFPIDGISLEDAEKYVNAQAKKINGTEYLNNSFAYRPCEIA